MAADFIIMVIVDTIIIIWFLVNMHLWSGVNRETLEKEPHKTHF